MQPKTTTSTVGKYFAQWEAEHGTLLPRCGTIHDIGPTLTHKKEIGRLLFIEGKAVSQVVNLTKLSARAIERYITNFRLVFVCRINGLTIHETAHTTKLSQRLVEEYHRPIDEYALANAKNRRPVKGLSEELIIQPPEIGKPSGRRTGVRI